MALAAIGSRFVLLKVTYTHKIITSCCTESHPAENESKPKRFSLSAVSSFSSSY